MKIAVFIVCWLAAFVVSAADHASADRPGTIDLNKNGKRDAYEDPSQPVEKRVSDLLKRMTLDEEIGQLWQIDLPKKLDPQVIARVRKGEVGSFLGIDATVETPVIRNK